MRPYSFAIVPHYSDAAAMCGLGTLACPRVSTIIAAGHCTLTRRLPSGEQTNDYTTAVAVQLYYHAKIKKNYSIPGRGCCVVAADPPPATLRRARTHRRWPIFRRPVVSWSGVFFFFPHFPPCVPPRDPSAPYPATTTGSLVLLIAFAANNTTTYYY